MIKAIFRSAMLMTWTSLLSRLVLSMLVLALVLNVLSPEELSVWFFFIIIARLRDIFDFGYLDNVARTYSYMLVDKDKAAKVTKVYSFARKKYTLFSWLCFISSLIIGGLGLYLKDFNPLVQVEYYFCLFLLSISNAVFIYGNLYVSYLFGKNRISILKGWDTFFNILNTISFFAVYYFSPSILNFLIVNSVWVILIVIRNYWLVGYKYRRLIVDEFEEDVGLLLMSKNSRKEFFSGLYSMGLIQGLNFYISTQLNISLSNRYLLLDNIIEQIKNLARVPFYVKRPSFAASSRGGGIDLREVKNAMLFSQVVLIIGCIFFYCLADLILSFVGSNVMFDGLLWGALFSAALLERYTAMHNQLFIIVNNVIKSHIFYFVTLIVFSTFMLVFYFNQVSYYFYPLALLLSYSCFFTWCIVFLNIDRSGWEFGLYDLANISLIFSILLVWLLI